MNTEIKQQMTTDLGFIPDIVELDYNNNLALGQGFDSLLGEKGGYTVKIDENRIVPTIFTKTNGVSTVYTLKIIENYSELRESLKMSVSASFKVGIFGVGGSYNSFSGTTVNSFDTYIFADVESTQVAKHIMPFELTDVALQATENTYSHFLKFAGDKFVSGVQMGARLTMLIRIISGKSEKNTVVKADINARISGFASGGANFETTLSQCIENKQIEVFILRIGSKEELPDIEQAVRYSKRVPLIADEEPYPLTYFLCDYNNVGNIPVDYIDEELLESRRQKLEYIIDPYEKLQTYLSDLKYANENIELFNVEKGLILNEIDKVEDHINQIKRYVRTLHDDPMRALPDIQLLEQINLDRKEVEPPSCSILKIYSEDYHNGAELEVNETISGMPSYWWNDRMKSYVLKEGYRAVFYVDSQFRGASLSVTGPSNPDMIHPNTFYKRISSIKIEKIN